MNINEISGRKKREGFKGEQYIVLPTEEFKEYANHPQVRRMLVTDIGFFPKAEHHYRERKEGIEEYIFLYCTAGSGTVNIEGKEYAVGANEALCIPRYKRHYYYASQSDPWSILWMHFKGGDTAFFPLEECRVIRFETENASERMQSMFKLLFRAMEAHYTLGNFIYIAYVVGLILAETYFREKRNATQIQNRHVSNIIRYMYRNIAKNLTLNQLSKEFGLSKSYLNSIFQEYTNHAPLDFFIELKMKEACKMLRLSDVHIYEVAQKLGYKDQYYFSRIFKKVVGISPSGYKQSDYFTEKSGGME